MAEKRKREEGAPSSAPKPDYRPGKKRHMLQDQRRKGFTVGPANLPDGAYKRKTQQIKDSLIKKAKLKKDYAKVKRQEQPRSEPEALPMPASVKADLERQRQGQQSKQLHSNDSAEQEGAAEADDFRGVDEKPTAAPHPDRQAQIDREANSPALEDQRQDEVRSRQGRRERRPKSVPFRKEQEQALRRKAEAEERRKAREEAERQRQLKIEERDRFRKAIAKAKRIGPNGQRKLGRESKVLLERVKRMVG